MTVKRIMPVLLIFLASISLGLFYNTYLIEYPWHTSLLEGYIKGILSVFLLVIQGWCIYDLCTPLYKKYKSNFPILLSSIFIITILLYVLRTRIFGVGYINVFIMLYVYPLVFLGMKEQFINKHGLINVTILFSALMIICLFVSDIKMILFSAIAFIITEIISINLFAASQKKKWYWHVGVLTVVSILSLVSVILLNWSIFERRIAGFFNPDTVLEYRMLLDWIGRCKLISFNLNKAFVNDINSMTACPYSHIMSCFGVLPTMLFICLQLYFVLAMFKTSTKFTEDSRKLLGMVSSAIVTVHLLISLASSFFIIPMVGYGAPVFLGTGLSYSYVPLLTYFYLEFVEIYLKYKNKQQ